MQRTNFETLDVYRLAEKLADEIWTVVATWDRFARENRGHANGARRRQHWSQHRRGNRARQFPRQSSIR